MEFTFFTCYQLLPSSWSNGEITGLKARTGVEVNLKWTKRKLLASEITSSSGKPIKIIYRGRMETIYPQSNVKYIVDIVNFTIISTLQIK
ncbi:glycoside hydrolase family 95-like protein [Algoriphagus sp.]|uniref:glycoside hydrolase family 95-like protein n=1 Tax=Algoriphagus sp. TaxID=1872435 RepID=UPI00343009B4